MESGIAIIGGGLAGSTLACLLGSKNIPCTLIELAPIDKLTNPSHDIRTTAISYGSAQIFKQAGIWDLLEGKGGQIDKIDILDGGSPVLLSFDHIEAQGNPFGWIFDNRELRVAMFERMKQLPSVKILAPASVADFTVAADKVTIHLTNGQTLDTQLVVGADGKFSKVRSFLNLPEHGWDYGQRAMVCITKHQNPHNNVAVEHFRPEGPFAILPMLDAEDGTHRSAVVWTEHCPPSASFMQFEDKVFEAGLQARFPANYGKVEMLGKRASFPLSLKHTQSYIGDRMVVVAEAAHVMHPIAGQGLNISLRDVAALAEQLENVADPGAPEILRAYEAARVVDTSAMLAATDTLNKLFGNDLAPLKLARRLGVSVVSRIAPVKGFFMRQAMGQKSR